MTALRPIILALVFLAASMAAAEPGKPATLPAHIVGDGEKSLWIPSGYMGETAAISMDGKSTDKPHSGSTSLKVTYSKSDGWAGVVWQDPVNDWGAKAGGWNLTGAKALKFWARGAIGNEKVKFGFGLIGADQPYPDTGKKETEVVLTPEWKEYSIDVTGLDLTRIKTGFSWVVGGQGAVVCFHLDDVRWE